MSPAPIPPNEPQRLAVLHDYEILDTAREESFDNIARLAAEVTGSPIALVSLVDADRQWFKARVGLDIAGTSRDASLCAHAILDPGAPLIVPDATRDPRFADSPLVAGPPGIRSYAGVPLVSREGMALGSLCVMDREPRHLSPEAIALLQGLARTVETALELRRTERTARDVALTDALTGMPNRPALMAALRGAVAEASRDGTPFLLAYLDLDGFKRVNDVQGHAAGDRVLREVADVLRRAVREGDLAARLGGDEFALLVRGGSAATGAAAAERARAGIEQRMSLHCWPVTASVGAVFFAAPPTDAEAALEHADHLMYEAKAAGRNRVASDLHDGTRPRRAMRPNPAAPDARSGAAEGLGGRGRRRSSGLVLAFCGLLLAGSVALGSGLAAWHGRNRALADAERELRNVSLVLADHADRALQTMEVAIGAVLERAAAEGALASADAFDAWAQQLGVHEALRSRSVEIPQSDALLLVGADGRLLSFSRSWPAPPNDLADREYFLRLRDEGRMRAVGPPVHNRGTGAWSMHLARRIEGPAGEFLGAAVGVVRLEYLERFYGNLSLGAGSNVAVFRDDGVLIARHPPIEAMVGQGFGDTEAFRAALATGDGQVLRLRSNLDGKDRLIAPRALSGFPLRVHVGVTADAVLANWRTETARLAAGAVLLLATIAAAVWIAIRKLRAEAEAAHRQRRLELASYEERHRMRDEMYAREALFREAVEGMSQGVWMFGPDGRLILTNGRCAEAIGLPQDALRPGASLAELAAGSSSPATSEALSRLAALVESGRPGSFVQNLGCGRTASVVHQPLRGGGWLATFEDISARRAAEERAARTASHDALTGLPNRASLRQSLAAILARTTAGAGQVAVLHIGLDRFRTVNDTLGSPIGDAVLQLAALRIARSVRAERDGGDLIARLGGDEFAVVTHPDYGLGTDAAANTAALAHRLIRVLAEPYEVDGQRVVLGATVGIALFPAHGAAAEDLTKKAAIALNHAKEAERGGLRFFEPDMAARVEARRLIEAELREALAATEAHGFELHYQPTLGAGTRRIRGFEALIRWRHPTRGLVPPNDFIPLAEELGLITQIGVWALHEACREAAAWPEKLRVAVNLSPVQFRDPGLVETVAAALAASRLHPGRLELEITEGVLLQGTAEVLATLHRLRALGLRIAMDDFGTGYSSLGYLRSFPFEKVKIDRSFVREITSRPDDVAIVHAVVDLCARLGMTTTAEGVETEEQAQLLAGQGCDELQGYRFSRPVPAADIPALVARLGTDLATGRPGPDPSPAG